MNSHPHMPQRQEPANPLEDFRGTPSSHDLRKHVLRQKQLWYHSDFQEIPASCCSLRRRTCLRFNKEEVSQGAGHKSSGKMWNTLNDTTTHHLIILCYLGILCCLTDLHDQRLNQSFDRYFISVQGRLRLHLFP